MAPMLHQNPSTVPHAGQENVHTNGKVPSTNGQLHFGQNGSVVFICLDPGLAQEMRKVVLPAVCNVREADQIKGAVDRRAVVVAYRGAESRTNAETAATWVQRECCAERVGSLDLVKL